MRHFFSKQQSASIIRLVVLGVLIASVVIMAVLAGQTATTITESGALAAINEVNQDMADTINSLGDHVGRMCYKSCSFYQVDRIDVP